MWMLAAVICRLGCRGVHWGCWSGSVGGEGVVCWGSVPGTYISLCPAHICFVGKLKNKQTKTGNEEDRNAPIVRFRVREQTLLPVQQLLGQKFNFWCFKDFLKK